MYEKGSKIMKWTVTVITSSGKELKVGSAAELPRIPARGELLDWEALGPGRHVVERVVWRQDEITLYTY